MRDEQAVPARHTQAGKTWWSPPLRFFTIWILRKSRSDEGAIVGRGALRLELLDRGHRLERQGDVHEAAVEHA